MREVKSQQPEETDAQEQQQIGTFQIRVRNKFNEDPRGVKVFHKDKDKKDKKIDDLIRIVGNQHIQQEGKNVGEYDLLPDDFLVIELGGEVGNFREFKKDVYIGLPFLADYEFFWEVRKGDKEKKLARPITAIKRNTTSDPEQQTTNARTVIKIPGDQRAWRLIVSSPGNLNEHYHAKNLHTKYLQMDNGEPDDVTVGENGTG